MKQGGGQLDDIVLVQLPDLCPKLVVTERDDNASVDDAAIIRPSHPFVVEDQAKHLAFGLLPLGRRSDRRPAYRASCLSEVAALLMASSSVRLVSMNSHSRE